MKKYLSLIVIAILFVACDSTNDFGTPFTKGQEVSLTAAIGEQRPQMLPGKQRVSGINAEEEIKLKWDEGDQIKVIVGKESAIFTLTSGAGSSDGSFTGIMPADGTNFRVEYPISEPDIRTQTYIENGFNNGLMKMVAENGTINGGFILKAQYALLGLQLVGNQTLSKIVVTNPMDNKTYTLLCSNVELSNRPTLFYIVVPAGEWSNGFKVDIYDSNNTHQKTLTKSSPASFSTTQATIMPVQGLDMIFNVNGMTFKMIYVEGGTFMMGAMDNDTNAKKDEKPKHQVTISDYYIAQTEMTQGLWKALMGTTLREHWEAHGSPDIPLAGEGEDYPMYKVNKEDCEQCITKLNQITGASFRLPTEAEWEYAARGGKYTHHYLYSGGNNLEEIAWYAANSENLTHPVAQLSPNELGLYDMSGNVWEWVSDWYEKYSESAQINPKGPVSGTLCTIRGGSRSTSFSATNCRVSARHTCAKDHRNFMGIRLVLEVIP